MTKNHRKEVVLSTPPPKIEFAETDLGKEIFLLDEDGTIIKKICGQQRKGLPEGYVCINEAGLETDHTGYGKCRLHGGLGESDAFWIKKLSLAINDGVDSALFKSMKAAYSHSEDLTDRRHYIVMLNGFLNDMLQKKHHNWQGKDTQGAIKIIEMIDRLMQSERIASENTKASQAISWYVTSLLQIVAKYVDRGSFERIKSEINLLPQDMPSSLRIEEAQIV